MDHRVLVALSLASALGAWVCTVAAAEPQNGWTFSVETVASPAAPGSGQPQLSVSSEGVLLSWIEKSGTGAMLKFAEWSGRGWSAPRTVASGDDWFVNWADVPSVVRLVDGSLAAHWLQKSGDDTYAYDVRLSYSTDNGETWSPSFMPHRDGTKTEHGFASLFQMPGAGLGLVWLDGRAMQADAAHGSHDGNGRGSMSVRFAAFDTRWQQTSEMLVDPRVCECCPTAVAVTADGPIAAFRNRTDDEIRDIHVSRFENGKWTDPTPVHADGWKIPACPVNGPMLSARDREVAIAWFTVKDDQGRAFVAFSRDAGRTFGAPIRLDDGGSLGRVDVELLPDGAAVATWIEFADQRAQFRARRVEAGGSKSGAVTISGIAGNRTSGYPRVARHGDDLVFAWTESTDGRTQVKTATAHVTTPSSAR
jgi:hypothetical protein